MSKTGTSKKQASLFATDAHIPLPERLRPHTLEDVVGQPQVTGEEGALTRFLQSGHLPSMIFWGPPGCGKTTIARLLASAKEYDFTTVSAVNSGVAELKKLFDHARQQREMGRPTLLFVDEIHRFNRAQQDAFLPVVEDGTVTLVGATTENPSFELNAALLSRCRVLVLQRLDESAMAQLRSKAEEYYGKPLPVDADAWPALCAMADGDGRYFLSLLEEIFAANPSEPLNVATLSDLVQQRAPVYDKTQESHYNLISALHKSLRGSDVQAALYWACRMLDGGEDPLYLARRLIRFAVEDIGMADPQALVQAIAGTETYERLGTPEGELAIMQIVVYLATAPKSNAVYKAYGAARRAAKEHGSLMPPMHILNAPTKLMKELGYSSGYAYDHDAQDAFSGQDYFPETMEREEFYRPVERGFERDILKRLEYWNKLRVKRQAEEND